MPSLSFDGCRIRVCVLTCWMGMSALLRRRHSSLEVESFHGSATARAEWCHTILTKRTMAGAGVGKEFANSTLGRRPPGP